jgi:hypothetical protein
MDAHFVAVQLEVLRAGTRPMQAVAVVGGEIDRARL